MNFERDLKVQNQVNLKVLSFVVSVHILLILTLCFSFKPNHERPNSKKICIQNVVLHPSSKSNKESLFTQHVSPSSKPQSPLASSTTFKPIESPESTKIKQEIKKNEKEKSKVTSKKTKAVPQTKKEDGKKSKEIDSSILKNLENNLKMVGSSPSKEVKTKETSETSFQGVSKLQSETLNENLNIDLSYEEEIALYIRSFLVLPEFGTVKIQLTIKKNGHIESIKIVHSESSKNTDYVQTHLSSLKLTPFGSFFKGIDHKTFTITLCNAE